MVGSGGFEPPPACARGRGAADCPTTRNRESGVSGRSRTGSNGFHGPAARRLPSPTVGTGRRRGNRTPVCGVWDRRPPIGRTGAWSRRRESNPHAGAYGAPKVTVPSLRKCEIDGLAGGPGGIRTLVSWVQTTDPAAERRAHPGEDNGTRTRTPALTTRRLPLRLCPPRDGRLAGIRTPICTV
jgi:hypothetical protein